MTQSAFAFATVLMTAALAGCEGKTVAPPPHPPPPPNFRNGIA